MTETTAPTAALAGDYQIDPAHTRLGFTVRHAMVTKVRGSFTDFSGTAHIDADPAASWVRLTIASASLSTGQEQRDAHVTSNDFLGAETYPEITFTSTAVELVGTDTYRITGDLTIRDTTRPVTIDFESSGVAKDPFGNVRAGFEGATTINRTDWGISFNAALETGGVLVSEKVGLEFDVSAIKTDA